MSTNKDTAIIEVVNATNTQPIDADTSIGFFPFLAIAIGFFLFSRLIAHFIEKNMTAKIKERELQKEEYEKMKYDLELLLKERNERANADKQE